MFDIFEEDVLVEGVSLRESHGRKEDRKDNNLIEFSLCNMLITISL